MHGERREGRFQCAGGGGWKGVEVCSRRNQFHLPPPDHSSVIAAAVMRDNWWDKNPAIRTQVRLGYSCILSEREGGKTMTLFGANLE